MLSNHEIIFCGMFHICICVYECVVVYVCTCVSVFDKVPYHDTPNGAGRCPLAQSYDKIWAMLARV